MDFSLTDEQKSVDTTWFQWEMVNQRMTKSRKVGKLLTVFDMLKAQLQNFLVHAFVKMKQSQSFESAKANVCNETAEIQVDFFRELCFEQQQEIQSAHWSTSQATVFTAYVWLPDKHGMSVAIVSDYLEHDKYAVHTFLSCLLNTVKSKHPLLKEIQFFSYGAGSHFKQKFLFVNLTFLQEEFSVKPSWHFFATSHGKGVVDGIGGTVNCLVWKESMAGKVIQSAEEMARVADEKSSKINVVFISATVIEERCSMLDDRWKDILPLPNTHSVHCVSTVKKYVVEYGPLSTGDHKTFAFRRSIVGDTTGETSDQVSVVTSGDFLLVKFCGKKSIQMYMAK